MELEAAAALGKGIALIGVIGSGLGQGYLIGKAIEAMSRNPERAGQALTYMFVGSAIAESGAIYALVGFFLLG